MHGTYHHTQNAPDFEKPWDSCNDPPIGRQVMDSWRLVRLTAGLGGLQVVWATVIAGSWPFMLSLGLPPSLVSFAWLAGPVYGILQPYIGHKSDFCNHRWGRRKPFIVYGTVATVVCINGFAWISEIVNLCLGISGTTPKISVAGAVTQSLVVFCVWLLNAAIQPVQMGLRALTVDCCHADQQIQVNRVTSSVMIIGGALACGCGFLEMPQGPPWIANSQFKCLCLISSLSLSLTVAITCTAVSEENPPRLSPDVQQLTVYQETVRTFRELPRGLKTVCIVQALSWLAWFPFLFSITSFLQMLYEDQFSLTDGLPADVPSSEIHEYSLRRATLVMLLFQVVALVTITVLPPLLLRRSVGSPQDHQNGCSWTNERNNTLENIEKLAMGVSEAPSRLTKNTSKLARAWSYSHVVTAICVLGATLGSDFARSTLFIAILGTSSALTQWAPYAIIATDIAPQLKATTSGLYDSIPRPSWDDQSSTSSLLLSEESLNENSEAQEESPDDDEPETKSRTATFMGVHNVAIAAPQLLSAVLNSLIYWLFDIFGLSQAEAMAWTLRIGCFSALAAAYYAHSLR